MSSKERFDEGRRSGTSRRTIRPETVTRPDEVKRALVLSFAATTSMRDKTPVAALAVVAAAVMMLSGCGPGESSPIPYFFATSSTDAEAQFDEERFRSFRKDGQLVAHVAMDEIESRLSLVPPLPSSLRYPLTLTTEPSIRFSTGVSTLGGKRARCGPSSSGSPSTTAPLRRSFSSTKFQDVFRIDGSSTRSISANGPIAPSSSPSRRALVRQSSLDRAMTPPAWGQTLLPAWGNPVLEDRLAESAHPNLILISIDCLRADHVGAYGFEGSRTPFLDRFARDAIVFDRAYAVSSWTLPTHMSMLTGVMPTRHGLSRSQKRNPSVPYLPELLSAARYQTLGVVSGLYLTPKFGFEEGFDVYQTRIDTPARELVDAALELMLTTPHRQRFLFLHLFDAHWPYLPPEEFFERAEHTADISDVLKKVIDEIPPAGEDEVETLRNLYNAEIAYIDSELGTFFRGAAERGSL